MQRRLRITIAVAVAAGAVVAGAGSAFASDLGNTGDVVTHKGHTGAGVPSKVVEHSAKKANLDLPEIGGIGSGLGSK